MPIYRIDNYLDAYRLRAEAEDLHELAARPDKKALTEFVNRAILDAIQPGPEDALVDIGCGDGSLLRMALGRVSACTGIVGSETERLRLESALQGVRFVACLAQSLSLESNSASKIVCNGVLFYLPHEDDVKAAVSEMARIACPGATIWVGEMPEIDEYAHYGIYRGTSMLGLLWHMLKYNGLRGFLGMCRQWLQAITGRRRIILNSAGIHYASPEKMIAMAQNSGLRLKAYFRHKELNDQGVVVESKFRYDYIFEK